MSTELTIKKLLPVLTSGKLSERNANILLSLTLKTPKMLICSDMQNSLSTTLLYKHLI